MTLSIAVLLASLSLEPSAVAEKLRFDDYPTDERRRGPIAIPRPLLPRHTLVSLELQAALEEPNGAVDGEHERSGPNFAGYMVVVRLACGAPCMRMVLLDSRTGRVFDPPITHTGIGAPNLDLPLLSFPHSVPMNPHVDFRRNSRLMIVKASLTLGHPLTYYFLWERDHWRLLHRTPVTTNPWE